MSLEERTTSSTGGQKGVKLERFDLIPVEPLIELATHFGRGATKYDLHQWRAGYEWSKSYSAICRHLSAFWAGYDYDVCENDLEGCQETRPDGSNALGTALQGRTCFNHTGSHHMTCVAWHSFVLLEFKDNHPGHDDRYRVRTMLKDQVAYGVRRTTGELILDPTWFSEADVMRGMGAWGEQAADIGVLVRFIDGEWRDVR